MLIRDETCSTLLNSDLEGEIFLSYMERLMMDCFSLIFQDFFSEHKQSKKREHLKF